MSSPLLDLPAPGADRAIGDRLQRYGRFGVHLGLDRIRTLLTALGQPQQQVPIIHVAGTNGKGSVCAYLSAILTAAGYRVGRYTSPHLVSWCERITLAERPIAPAALLGVLDQVEAAIAPGVEPPTQFEVFTAAAWLYFAQQRVDIAVVEVGLGGRLDATNVVDRPLVSVITSLSRDHWQQLGATLGAIAQEKAGILKPGCPAVVGPLPPEAEAVVMGRVAALGCPLVRPQPALALGSAQAQVGDMVYSLPLPGHHQLINSAVAIATVQRLQHQGWAVPGEAIAAGMAATRWPGRLQWLTWQDAQGNPHPLLVDGAHNGAAAVVLRQYIDGLITDGLITNGLINGIDGWVTDPDPVAPVTWVMGMLSTKDHAAILGALLRPGDRLHLVPVPDHLSEPVDTLAELALTLCPGLGVCRGHPDLATGLETAFQASQGLTVLCGSLYLVGHGFATLSFRRDPETSAIKP